MHIQNGSTDIVSILFAKRISDSTDAEIQEKLLKIFVLVGLRMQHYPDKYHNQFLINYIRKEYGHKTLEELQLAFELSIKQELDLEDYKVYDNFSIEYLCRIMNAYRIWLVNENKKLVKKNDIEVDIIVTERDKMEDIEYYLKRTDINLANIHLIPLYLYDNMVELNLINHTDKQKALLYSKALKSYENKLLAKASSFDKNDIKQYNTFLKYKSNDFADIPDELVQNIVQLFKRISVLDYIKTYQKEINEK